MSLTDLATKNELEAYEPLKFKDDNRVIKNVKWEDILTQHQVRP